VRFYVSTVTLVSTDQLMLWRFNMCALGSLSFIYPWMDFFPFLFVEILIKRRVMVIIVKIVTRIQLNSC